MSRRVMLSIAAVLVVALSITVKIVIPVTFAQQPQPVSTTEGSTPLIKAETRLVLVDTIVTDKKGNYIGDLVQKDFKVYEDDKEQPITSFSAEAGQGTGKPDEKHYLVLFFDNSTMDMTDQARARDAAAKFIAANAGPDRLIAIVDFTGAVHIAQNFTADADRLTKIVSQAKFSAVNPNAGVQVASLGMSLEQIQEGVSAEAVSYAAGLLVEAIRNYDSKEFSTVRQKITLSEAQMIAANVIAHASARLDDATMQDQLARVRKAIREVKP